MTAAQPDRAIGTSKRRRGKSRRPLRSRREDCVDRGFVLAKLFEPGADWGNRCNHRFGQHRLERAESLAGEARQHGLDAFVGQLGKDADEVLRLGPPVE